MVERYVLSDKVIEDKSSIQAQYSKLETDREPYLERARDCAALTIPTLYPHKGSSEATQFDTPYQSIGARGTMNLASKLMLALFPPHSPFFRLSVDDLVYKQIQGDPQQRQTIEEGLNKIEKAVMDNLEVTNDRVAVYEALKQLIVSGNVLLRLTDKGLRVYRLNNYVIKRDPQGSVLKIIIKESININTLPPKIRVAVLEGKDNQEEYKDKDLELYTCITREPKYFRLMQECNKKIILTKEIKLDQLPFIALRFNRVDGMDYGRSHCEAFLGDLKSLEGLTRSILEGSSASAKMLFMVSPNGTTRASALSSAPNGAIIEGNSGDVSVLQANKFADFRIAFETMNRIETRLNFAFLLNASVQRQAERVTATEISLIASELQDALGGVYGLLTTEFQLPYITAKLAMLREQKLLPNLPKDIVRPKIIVGLEALGRASDRLKLLQFMSDLAGTLGADVLARHINLDNAIKKFAVANGIETDGLLKSAEQIQQEQQQQQAQQFAQKSLADPRVAIEAGKSLTNSNVQASLEDGQIALRQEE
ncbi:head-to-tail joining protein [uncultured phage_Deep-GF0-KM16-C193]|uniref:Head-to-tail joining protein n=1 Tax=uncultured phage_Deep-GF0-KM16-C193 TaxID=2740799 RepID=A0A1B1IWN7_9CAUD|nr:head-to-tail joining protein [uncultured phage_Deep-GF0-KM16-C193]ANS05745.1 head-to-tail joining protein [uncultured phage_Deep-GF0-KM16-C193]